MTHKGCSYYGYNPVISNTNTTQTQIDMDIGNTFSLKDEYIRDKYKTSKIEKWRNIRNSKNPGFLASRQIFHY